MLGVMPRRSNRTCKWVKWYSELHGALPEIPKNRVGRTAQHSKEEKMQVGHDCVDPEGKRLCKEIDDEYRKIKSTLPAHKVSEPLELPEIYSCRRNARRHTTPPPELPSCGKTSFQPPTPLEAFRYNTTGKRHPAYCNLTPEMEGKMKDLSRYEKDRKAYERQLEGLKLLLECGPMGQHLSMVHGMI
eukprot:TRINITY_DN10301_c0_g2_i1.p1 TRINITY_DN10301_c0_g2~~TRINITY_DN10301_c0_g2_i1.p1  ORF type:complete len:187 (+),score=16.87 TRINITY_DN10301_c0_g2_i1:296-856(+)